MDKGKALVTGAAILLIIIGTAATKFDDWFGNEPTGPGSGDELPDDYVESTGPGSGDELPDDYKGEVEYNDGKDRGNGPGEPGPGSGDELPDDEPTGPGSGDELPDDYVEPTGPGSGDELPSDEPTGPGSGDELPDDYVEPTGPGSGDELPDDEPTGPGSGDELPADEPTGPGSGDEVTEESLKDRAIASCNAIGEKSTCVEYIGSYWATPEVATLNCRGVGIYSEKPCPRPTSGGCRMSPDQIIEMVSWFYPYGGDPIAGETITYAAGACNANPMSHYIFSN